METTQSSKTPVIIVCVLFVVLLLGYVFMSKNKTNTSVATPSPDTPLITESDTPVTDEKTAAVLISGTEFSFSQTNLTFSVGKPVTITFTNTGKMPHDFVIDEIAGAKTSIIKGGETTSVTFTPTTAGTFKFYCSVGNHRSQGMEGTVTVE